MRFPIPSLIIAIALSFAASASLADEEEMAAFQAIEITKKTDVRFPGTMRAIGVKEGRVSLVASIDTQGKILDTFVLESTRHAFTKSALKSLSEWEFTPALCDGQPIDSSIRIDLSFQVDRKLAWQTFQAPGPADVTRTQSDERPVTTARFGELDAIPFPIEIVEPTAQVEGVATIEFYIDELGHVRCPRITAGTSLAFGQTLLEAVSQWKFEPPVSEGNRTNTMVRQSFSFKDGKLSSVAPL